MPVSGGPLARLARIRARIPNELDEWAVEGATEIMEEARFLIRDGAIPPPNHVPSLPGQPAKEEYGDLARDMTVESAPEPGAAYFIAYSDHAAHTEFGTSKMAERPWARPAAANKRQHVLTLARNAVNRAIK